MLKIQRLNLRSDVLKLCARLFMALNVCMKLDAKLGQQLSHNNHSHYQLRTKMIIS